MFHTGTLHAIDTSFVANRAGVEGPAVMSIGFLEELSNANFAGNNYYCRAGEYSYIDKHEARATK